MRSCFALWPSRASSHTFRAWARGLGNTEEAQDHPYLLHPVLLPSALTRAVDERSCGHFVVIQQADNDHDHHCNCHNDDDDLGELQLRCNERGNCVKPHALLHHHPLSSPDLISSRHCDYDNHQASMATCMNLVLIRSSWKWNYFLQVLLPRATASLWYSNNI